MRHKHYIWIAASVIAFLCLVVGLARMLFEEDLESKQGTLTYFITITSKTIKHFPVIKPEGGVIFSSSPGDGPPPPSQGLHYVSGEKVAVLEKLTTSYLIDSGYKKIEKKGFFFGGAVFRKKGVEFELYIGNLGDDKSEIKAMELFWYKTGTDESAWQ